MTYEMSKRVHNQITIFFVRLFFYFNSYSLEIIAILGWLLCTKLLVNKIEKRAFVVLIFFTFISINQICKRKQLCRKVKRALLRQ